MIGPQCDKCKKELKDFGGLAFSPPYPNRKDMVYKFHLCKDCWQKFVFWMNLK